MAINRISEPANPPTAIGDWTQIIALVRAAVLGTEIPLRVVGTNVVKGAVFQVGGTVYQADANTAISGTPSEYVKLTPAGDGSTLSASFVASLVAAGVAWNSTYNGWYDGGTPDCLYIFDEGKAKTAAQIPAIMKNRDLTVPMGTGWLAALAVNLGANWATAFAAEAGLGMLARLLPVDGHASGLDADLLDGIQGAAIFGVTAGDYVMAGPFTKTHAGPNPDFPSLTEYQEITYICRKKGTIRLRIRASVTPASASPPAAQSIITAVVYLNGSIHAPYHEYSANNTGSTPVYSLTADRDVAVNIGDIVSIRTVVQVASGGVASVSLNIQCAEEGRLYSELE